MKIEIKYPYPECETCQVLDDCPCPQISDNPFCSPMPPDNCPFPIEIMKRTIKKHRLIKRESKN